MALSTTLKTAEEGAKVASGLNPAKGFVAADFAAEVFPKIQAELPAKAVTSPSSPPRSRPTSPRPASSPARTSALAARRAGEGGRLGGLGR